MLNNHLRDTKTDLVSDLGCSGLAVRGDCDSLETVRSSVPLLFEEKESIRVNIIDY
jgi:hypothetical protein